MLLPLLFVNTALADSTTDARIQAYKSNKLIPEGIVLPTSTNATDSQEVVAFSTDKLTWASGTVSQLAMNALTAKYGDMSLAEIKDAMGPAGYFDCETLYDWVEYGWLNTITSEIQEIREYLSAVANGRVESDALTRSEALHELQEQFDSIAWHGLNDNVNTVIGAFPCEGIDFSSYTGQLNLSQCTGITGEQILSADNLSGTTLPAITFDGTENFSGKKLSVRRSNPMYRHYRGTDPVSGGHF